MIGNKHARDTLEQFFAGLAERPTQQERAGVPFLLLSGPEHVGKTTLVEEHIHKLLGAFALQDYLSLYDCGSVLGKNHTLKVSVPSKDQRIKDDDGVQWHNLGAREVVEWLSRSPVGGWKVVFLENIERMTTSAANALLKSLEEPLPGRLIVATTSNYKLLLDTIISRAMIVRFEPIGFESMSKWAMDTFPNVAEPLRRFAVSYSAGAPGKVHALLSGKDSVQDMSECFNKTVTFYKQGGSLVPQYHRFQTWAKQYGSVGDLLTGLLYSLDPVVDTKAIQHLVSGKKLLGTAVSDDTIYFHLSLDTTLVDDTIV